MTIRTSGMSFPMVAITLRNAAPLTPRDTKKAIPHIRADPPITEAQFFPSPNTGKK